MIIIINEGSINLNKNPIRIKNVLSILVHPKEGDHIPHFHIQRDGLHDCCIMFNENRYFSHGSNDTSLSGKEEKELDEWLRRPNKSRANVTNFQVLGEMWNGDRSTKLKVDLNRDFNYTNIKPYKE